MDIQEYQKWTRTTAFLLDDKDKRIDYILLGLASEVGELAYLFRDHKNREIDAYYLVNEMGDVLWYLSRIMDENGLSFYDSKWLSKEMPKKPLDYLLQSIVYYMGEILAVYKRKIRESVFDVDKLVENIYNCLYFLKNLADYFGFFLEDIADVNYLKINKRIKNGTIHGSGDDR